MRSQTVFIGNMTTKVNLLLPIFEINLPCNNPQYITEFLQNRYSDLIPAQIYWLQQKNGSQECVVRIANIKHNLDSIIELTQSNLQLQQTVHRLKQDIFNIMESVAVESQNEALKGDKLKQQLKLRQQEGSVSVKMEPGTYEYSQYSQYATKRLVSAVSELTRQNIRLKDALSYYCVQLQLMQEQKKSHFLKQVPKNDSVKTNSIIMRSLLSISQSMRSNHIMELRQAETVSQKYVEVRSSNKSEGVEDKIQFSENQQIISDAASSIIAKSEIKEIEKKRSRCLTERQRQLLVAFFGTSLSATMTILLIYLLNQIRG